MQVQDLYLTVAILEGNKPKVLYVGPDATRAQNEYASAGAEVLEVGVISHPQCVMPRRPREEAEALEAGKLQAEAEAQAASRAKELKLAGLKAQQKELQAQIDAFDQAQAPNPKTAKAKD